MLSGYKNKPLHVKIWNGTYKNFRERKNKNEEKKYESAILPLEILKNSLIIFHFWMIVSLFHINYPKTEDQSIIFRLTQKVKFFFDFFLSDIVPWKLLNNI